VLRARLILDAKLCSTRGGGLASSSPGQPTKPLSSRHWRDG